VKSASLKLLQPQVWTIEEVQLEQVMKKDSPKEIKRGKRNGERAGTSESTLFSPSFDFFLAIKPRKLRTSSIRIVTGQPGEALVEMQGKFPLWRQHRNY
jgi:hypothetical protein